MGKSFNSVTEIGPDRPLHTHIGRRRSSGSLAAQSLCAGQCAAVMAAAERTAPSGGDGTVHRVGNHPVRKRFRAQGLLAATGCSDATLLQLFHPIPNGLFLFFSLTNLAACLSF